MTQLLGPAVVARAIRHKAGWWGSDCAGKTDMVRLVLAKRRAHGGTLSISRTNRLRAEAGELAEFHVTSDPTMPGRSCCPPRRSGHCLRPREVG